MANDQDKQYQQNDLNSSSIIERDRAKTDKQAANNANTINNAADVAISSKHPVAAGIGAAIKGADALTGGKSSEALGKAMAQKNKFSPQGRATQKASDFLSESGTGDKIGDAASFSNGINGSGKANNAGKGQQVANVQQQGSKGAELVNEDALKKHDQLPNSKQNNSDNKDSAAASDGDAASSSDEEAKEKKKRRLPSGRPSTSTDEEEEEFSNDSGSKMFGQFMGFIGKLILPTIISFLPIIMGVVTVIIVVGVVMTCINDFSDTFSFRSFFESGDSEELQYDDSYMEEYYDSLDNPSKSSNLVVDDNKKASAVAHIIVENGGRADLSSFSSFEISSFKSAFASDDETTKTNLAQTVFPQYFPNNTYEENYTMASDVINYLNDYAELAVNENSSGASGMELLMCSSGSGSCTYGIKGFSFNGRNVSKNMNISNLQVRLMQTNNFNSDSHFNGTCGQPMANEELVPFEKYVLGVGYAEIGCPNDENYFKAMLVAARSFSLTRPESMNNACGLKLAQDNNKWILQIRMSVADQAYCDPDKGCSHESNGQWFQLHSGTGSGIVYKKALSSSSKCRTWASEVEGQVLVNSLGNVVLANYAQTEQTKMEQLAASGMSYKQILLQLYSNATDIKTNNCGQIGTCSGSGEYASWKQMDSKWSNVELDHSGATIGEVGCLATSIAIQVKRSGVNTSSVGGDFNPGTFVQAMNKHNGFSSDANLQWYGVTATVPGFQYVGKVKVLNKTKQEKLQVLSELINKGYYVVAEVKGNTGQHWVAVESISGDNIKMMDPGSTATNMWNEYGSENTSTYAYFRVNK